MWWNTLFVPHFKKSTLPFPCLLQHSSISLFTFSFPILSSPTLTFLFPPPQSNPFCFQRTPSESLLPPALPKGKDLFFMGYNMQWNCDSIEEKPTTESWRPQQNHSSVMCLVDLPLLRSYREHCVGHVWIHQARSKLKVVSHGAQVLPLPTAPTMRAYMLQLVVSRPNHGVVPCCK